MWNWQPSLVAIACAQVADFGGSKLHHDLVSFVALRSQHGGHRAIFCALSLCFLCACGLPCTLIRNSVRQLGVNHLLQAVRTFTRRIWCRRINSSDKRQSHKTPFRCYNSPRANLHHAWRQRGTITKLARWQQRRDLRCGFPCSAVKYFFWRAVPAPQMALLTFVAKASRLTADRQNVEPDHAFIS